LSPDLIAVPLVRARELSHSLAGLVLLDLPLALILAFAWNAAGRQRLQRLPGLAFPRSGAFSWRLALVGATLGGGTHLFWDLFTHDRAPDFLPCAFCSVRLFDTPAGPFQVGQLSWYVNSALGIAVVLVWLFLAARRARGWPKVFLSPVWFRLVFIPLVPITYVLLSSPRGQDHPIRDTFLHLILDPSRIRMLVAMSGTLALVLLAWETRVSGNPVTSNPIRH
jgi:membrane-bound metal-dependent hydrolase YbcI (DUF457 family)